MAIVFFFFNLRRNRLVPLTKYSQDVLKILLAHFCSTPFGNHCFNLINAICKFHLLLIKQHYKSFFFCLFSFQVVSYCPHCLFIPPYKGSLFWLLDFGIEILVKMEAAFFFFFY